MKFLISNYSTPWNTEPYYFNAGLLMAGEESSIFDTTISVYDNFDKSNPDVFICHVGNISKDLIHYIKENPKIKLLFNINAADTNLIEKAHQILNTNNINYIFFGNQDSLPQIDNIKYLKLLPGADVFINKQKSQYNIDKLIFIDSKNQIEKLSGTYHYTTTNPELGNDVDLFFPIMTLSLLFNNYDEIIFKGNSYIGSQISFNAIYSGTKVIFDTKENVDLDKIDAIFKKQKLLTSVKNKHTCLHRLKSLMSQLSYNEIAIKIERLIEKL